FMHVRDKVWQYVKRAGTVILLASALIWVATTYPKADSAIVSGNKAAVLEYSLAGRIGKIVEPLVRPLGFDWKMSVSALTGFAAKEISVSTLSILYQNGDAQGAARKSLREALREDRAFTPLVAFVLMLFTLIIAPCFSALAAIRSETGARWLAFNLVYTFIAAYAVCFGVYQIGRIIW
ncbi:MAG: nucleoside recognition domain-containing protein, partial [Candidatus Omnitrophota bacterium]